MVREIYEESGLIVQNIKQSYGTFGKNKEIIYHFIYNIADFNTKNDDEQKITSNSKKDKKSRRTFATIIGTITEMQQMINKINTDSTIVCKDSIYGFDLIKCCDLIKLCPYDSF